jgi:hypothetical protein
LAEPVTVCVTFGLEALATAVYATENGRFLPLQPIDAYSGLPLNVDFFQTSFWLISEP